jgi:hypothetical protein
VDILDINPTVAAIEGLVIPFYAYNITWHLPQGVSYVKIFYSLWKSVGYEIQGF